MNELTIIIPFLNEGEELHNTIQSIREHAGKNVDVLLIDDASTDDCDYRNVAVKFDATYIRNEQRLGVAASRDKGIGICRTPYFLLLDAHMRFYDAQWLGIIIRELKADERTLLCCQTKVLQKEDGHVYEDKGGVGWGACFQFDFQSPSVDIKWNVTENDPMVLKEEIPCVLGAAYAATKTYWNYLRGLSGLKSFGHDEAYISLKVWLEGGKCILLKDAIVGHIYRTRAPYLIPEADFVYNQLLVADLLLPVLWQGRILEVLKKKYGQVFVDAYKRLRECPEVPELKEYYRKIFTREFDYILSFNKLHQEAEQAIALLEKDKAQILSESIVSMKGQVVDPGLLRGKIGMVIFLCHYARHVQNDYFDEVAGELWEELVEEIAGEVPVTFGSGICGIGWGMLYLRQHSFVEGDIEHLLEKTDCRVMERNPVRLTDWSLQSGLSGILHYVMYRLKTSHLQTRFDPLYLEDLRVAALRMIADHQTLEHLSIAFQYVKFIEEKALDYTPLQLDVVMDIPPFFRNNVNDLKVCLKQGGLTLENNFPVWACFIPMFKV